MHQVPVRDAVTFLNYMQNTLEVHESANNLILGLSMVLRQDPDRYEDPYFAVVQDNDDLPIFSALMTPPHPIIVQGKSDNLEAIDLVIEECLTRKINVPGVNGQADVSRIFARQWSQKTGKRAELHKELRAYELVKVSWPLMPLGEFRPALPADFDILLKYAQAMQDEIEPEVPIKIAPERFMQMIRNGSVFLWEFEAEPVSIAQTTRQTRHTITISGVYTPPQVRGKGYASACVASLSQRMLDRGFCFVNLFTDLANLTSNAIYQKIGYKPVCDYYQYFFV